MISEGYYTGRGIKAQLAESGEKRTPKVEVLVEVTDEGEYRGTRMRWDGWLTDAAAPRTMEALRTLGWQGELLTDLTGIDQNPVQIVVRHEEYEKDGEIKKAAKVAFINRLGGGGSLSGDENRIEGRAAAALAQRFRALARGIPASAPAGKATPKSAAKPAPRNGGPPPHAPGAPDFGDDDIPF